MSSSTLSLCRSVIESEDRVPGTNQRNEPRKWTNGFCVVNGSVAGGWVGPDYVTVNSVSFHFFKEWNC